MAVAHTVRAACAGQASACSSNRCARLATVAAPSTSLRFEPLSAPGVLAVLGNLVDGDQEEIAAAGLADPAAAFLDVLEECRGAVVTAGGVHLCAFGTRPFPGAVGVGIVWMVSTPALRDHLREVIRCAPGVVEQLQEPFHELINCTHGKNAGALAFVRRIGFRVGTEPVGPGGAFFIISR